jgi:hypothetical protein
LETYVDFFRSQTASFRQFAKILAVAGGLREACRFNPYEWRNASQSGCTIGTIAREAPYWSVEKLAEPTASRSSTSESAIKAAA